MIEREKTYKETVVPQQIKIGLKDFDNPIIDFKAIFYDENGNQTGSENQVFTKDEISEEDFGTVYEILKRNFESRYPLEERK